MRTIFGVAMVVTVLGLAPLRHSASAGDAAPSWQPRKTVEFVATSSPGGGTDIFVRTIADIMAKEGLVKQTIVVNNQSDGGGEVGRSRVANSRDDHILVPLNSGGIAGMLRNTNMRIDSFTPLAVMATDKHLIFFGEHTKYKDIKEAIDAAKNGTRVVIGGSRTDDVSVYELFLKEIGVGEDVMPYITYDSTAEAVTSLLGGHIELCVGKPAATLEYVKAGRMKPMLACSEERFAAPFDQAPIMSEIGFKNIEFPLWRGVVGPKALSPEAKEYWSWVLGKVAASELWKQYLERNMLQPSYMDADKARDFMKKFEDEVKAGLDKKK